MTVPTYWISKTFVVEWKLTNLAGTPTDATVTGTVSLPDGTTDSMVVLHPATGTYRLTYDPQVAGWFTWKARAVGTIDDAEEGTFYVRPSLVGGPPVVLDPTTAVGQVRLLISDTDEDNLVFSDAEISAFLALEGASVRLAAAQALDTIASNEVMVSKVIRTQDLATDGAKVADALRKHAASLRATESASTAAAGAAVGIRTTGYDPLNLTGARVARPWIGNGPDVDYLDPSVRHLGLP